MWQIKLEMKKIEIEERKIQAQIQAHKIEERRIEAQREEQAHKIEERKIQAQIQAQKIDAEKEIKLAELRVRPVEVPAPSGNNGSAAGSARAWDDSLAGRTKRFGETPVSYTHLTLPTIYSV